MNHKDMISDKPNSNPISKFLVRFFLCAWLTL